MQINSTPSSPQWSSMLFASNEFDSASAATSSSSAVNPWSPAFVSKKQPVNIPQPQLLTQRSEQKTTVGFQPVSTFQTPSFTRVSSTPFNPNMT